MIYKAMQSPSDPTPPIVDNNNNGQNNQNNQNNSQQPDNHQPGDKPIASDDDKNHLRIKIWKMV